MTDFNMLAVDYHDVNAGEKFTQSLHETGFAVLKNHPIAQTQIEDMYRLWGDFFSSDEKHDYLFDPKVYDGYFPFQSENAKGAKAKDLKEFYHIYPHGRLPQFVEATSRAFYQELVTLGREMLCWIEDNSPSDIKAKYSISLPDMIKDSMQNLLRILYYPALEGQKIEAGAVRAAAHEDINLITLLVAGSESGLEAQDRYGNWHKVPCDQGMIAVNIGDMLQKASDGYFPSTTHRVINPEGDHSAKPRYSMPMFIHPRPEVMLDATYSAKAYLDERLAEIGLK